MIGLRVIILVCCVLVLGVFPCFALSSSEEEADSASEAQTSSLYGSLAKLDQRRPFHFRFYWEDGLHYEGGRTYTGEKEILKALRQVNLRGTIGVKLSVDGAGFFEEQGLTGFEDDVEVRRARLYTKGHFFLLIPIDFKIELGVNRDFFVVNDFYLRFNYDQYIDYYGNLQQKPSDDRLRFDNLQIGVFTAPMGMEALEGSAASTFMEFGAPISAFAPGDLFGIQAKGSGWAKRFTWTVGIYSPNPNQDVGDASSSLGRAMFRFTLLPWQDEEEDSFRLLHLGLSGNYTYSGSDIQYRSRPESHVAPFMIDTGTIPAKWAFIYGIEGALAAGPFSVQAEYIQSFVNDDFGKDLTFNGLYVYGSWLMTGEHRPYNKSKGTFDRVMPKRNFSLKKRGLGAWEVALRFSHTNLNDGYIKGGKMNVWGAGVNWYLNSHLRLAFNYLHAYTRDRHTDPTKNGRANILTCRFDLQF